MAGALAARRPPPRPKMESRAEGACLGGAGCGGKEAVMVATRAGVILHLTPAAVVLVERYCPTALENSCQLPREWMKQMEGRLQDRKGGYFPAARGGMAAPNASAFRLEVRFRAAANGEIQLWLEERRGGVAGREGGSPRLTRREAEVLHWIVETKTNPEIAMILGISPRTVHKHVEHILRKLGVENRGAAARCHYSL